MYKTRTQDYESRQQFNRLVVWLHSFRYQYLIREVSRIAGRVGERPVKILDIGAGPGNVFKVLDPLFNIDYTGIELAAAFVEQADERYGEKDNFRMVNESATESEELLQQRSPDVIVSLEALEHIAERDVVRLVETLAGLKPSVFLCSVPVEIGPAIWMKNVGSLVTGYMRHREYTWSETFWSGLYQLDRVPPHGRRHKGFDWRWLAQTIRHNFSIERTHRFPVPLLPAAVSASVFFVAKPRKIPVGDD